MFLPRIIPILLLKNKGLVKTIQFKKPNYIGDPINAVKLFNDLKVDELIFLDIDASKENRSINYNLVKEIGDEAFMPFGVGGGISRIDQVGELIKAGAEKVIINTQAAKNPKFVEEAARIYGSQSIVVSIDVKKNIFGKYEILTRGGTEKINIDIINYAKFAENIGAGELIINSIDLDGTMKGYDVKLISKIAESVTIPVVACGGAGNLLHLKEVFLKAKAHALAAGSMFVYYKNINAVLINYPSKTEIIELFLPKE